jgi:zinc finger protein 830
MSATFRLEKKKASQQDLRRLMQEQRSSKNGETTKKIESAFAKYENGQLWCSLCNSMVKSEKVWQVHVNAKQHRDNLAKAKELKAKIHGQVKKVQDPVDRIQGLKRSIEEMRSEVPEKKIKGILKNSSSTTTVVSSVVVQETKKEPSEPAKPTSAIPDDFFDPKKQAIPEDVTEEKMQVDDPLPEGFFDDPVKDAKIRNQEYKDPVEEEWEKFQKEIKEAEAESKVMINEEHEEATVEGQLDEIDEQIRNWSR